MDRAFFGPVYYDPEKRLLIQVRGTNADGSFLCSLHHEYLEEAITTQVFQVIENRVVSSWVRIDNPEASELVAFDGQGFHVKPPETRESNIVSGISPEQLGFLIYLYEREQEELTRSEHQTRSGAERETGGSDPNEVRSVSEPA